MAMVKVQQGLQDERRAARMVMQVHDELILEVPEAEIGWARQTIPAWMAGVAQLKVPLLAEAGIGPNWDRAH
jgi:DNA polymerase-1